MGGRRQDVVNATKAAKVALDLVILWRRLGRNRKGQLKQDWASTAFS